MASIDIHRTTSDPAPNNKYGTVGSNAGDDAYPYSIYTANNISYTVDSPGIPLLTGDNETHTTETFKMYAFWRSTETGVPTIPIPLKMISWAWSGSAHRLPDFTWNFDGGGRTAGSAVDVGLTFPQWNGYVRDIPENPE